MTLKISKQLAPVRPGINCFGTGNKHDSVTIHQTGNTKKGANAQMHAKLQAGVYGASWHWQVDDVEAIKSFENNVSCYHASDGRGPGNLNSIAIEGCINIDGDYIKTIHNMAELAAKVLKEIGKDTSRMFQHNHFDTKYHKNCPAQIRAGKDGINWALFVQMVKDNMKGTTVNPDPSTPSSSGSYTVKKGDTLWEIANTHKSTVDNLKSLNGLKSDIITPGQVLKLSGTVTTAKPATKPAPAKTQATGDPIIRDIQANVGTTQDGWGGPNTRKGVVKLFQRYFGANADGIIGPETLGKSQVIRSGSQGWHVYAAQAMLYLKGYKSVGKPDKVFGANSIQATKNFQKANGLAIDGTLGKDTYRLLFK